MKHFVVYDISTGTVLRRGSCMAVDFARQAGEGEAVIETDGPASGDPFVRDGVRSPSRLPAKPGPGVSS